MTLVEASYSLTTEVAPALPWYADAIVYQVWAFIVALAATIIAAVENMHALFTRSAASAQAAASLAYLAIDNSTQRNVLAVMDLVGSQPGPLVVHVATRGTLLIVLMCAVVSVMAMVVISVRISHYYAMSRRLTTVKTGERRRTELDFRNTPFSLESQGSSLVMAATVDGVGYKFVLPTDRVLHAPAATGVVRECPTAQPRYVVSKSSRSYRSLVTFIEKTDGVAHEAGQGCRYSHTSLITAAHVIRHCIKRLEAGATLYISGRSSAAYPLTMGLLKESSRKWLGVDIASVELDPNVYTLLGVKTTSFAQPSGAAPSFVYTVGGVTYQASSTALEKTCVRFNRYHTASTDAGCSGAPGYIADKVTHIHIATHAGTNICVDVALLWSLRGIPLIRRESEEPTKDKYDQADLDADDATSRRQYGPPESGTVYFEDARGRLGIVARDPSTFRSGADWSAIDENDDDDWEAIVAKQLKLFQEREAIADAVFDSMAERSQFPVRREAPSDAAGDAFVASLLVDPAAPVAAPLPPPPSDAPPPEVAAAAPPAPSERAPDAATPETDDPIEPRAIGDELKEDRVASKPADEQKAGAPAAPEGPGDELTDRVDTPNEEEPLDQVDVLNTTGNIVIDTKGRPYAPHVMTLVVVKLQNYLKHKGADVLNAHETRVLPQMFYDIYYAGLHKAQGLGPAQAPSLPEPMWEMVRQRVYEQRPAPSHPAPSRPPTAPEQKKKKRARKTPARTSDPIVREAPAAPMAQPPTSVHECAVTWRPPTAMAYSDPKSGEVLSSTLIEHGTARIRPCGPPKPAVRITVPDELLPLIPGSFPPIFMPARGPKAQRTTLGVQASRVTAPKIAVDQPAMRRAMARMIAAYPKTKNPVPLWQTESAWYAVVSALKRDSHPGLPYCNTYATIGDALDDPQFVEDLRKDVLRVLRRLTTVTVAERAAFEADPTLAIKEGLSHPVVVIIKMQPESEKKHDSGASRYILCLSLRDQIVQRMLYTPQNVAEKSQWEDIPSKPGMGLEDGPCAELAAYVAKHMPHPVSTDMSAWDNSVQRPLMSQEPLVRLALCQDATPAFENALLADSALRSSKIMVLSDGTMVSRTTGGLWPSGSYITSSGGSHMRVLAAHYVAEILGYPSEAAAMAMGDDCVENVPFAVDLQRVETAYKDLLGLTVTDATRVTAAAFEFCSNNIIAGKPVPNNPSRMVAQALAASVVSNDSLRSYAHVLRHHPLKDAYMRLLTAIQGRGRAPKESL